MNKLGYQFEVFGEAQRQMLRQAPPYTVKIMQGGKSVPDLKDWRGRSSGPLVCRYVFDPGPLEDMTRRLDASFAFYQDVLPVGNVWLEVPYNEEHQNGPALLYLAEASIGAARRIREHGYRPVVLITSEGNPYDLSQWQDVRLHAALRELRKLDAVWGPHEYSAPPLEPLDGWHSGRWRKAYDILPSDCRLPIYFGECGIDGGIATGVSPQRMETGYKGFMDAKQYAGWLNQLGDAYAADPRVYGAAVFLSGTYGRWQSFDIGDEVDLREPFTRSIPGPPLWVPPVVVEVPPPPPPPPPLTGPAIKAKGQKMSNISLSMNHRESPAYEGNYSKTKRSRTIGVVIHSTGGESNLPQKEFVSTVNWFQNPSAEVSAHYVIGPDEVARCVDDDLTAWHAREQNNIRIGIELAHADTEGANLIGYSSFQYAALGEIVGKLASKYGFPLVHVTDDAKAGLIAHKETVPGKKDGKRDPTGPFDWDRLITEAKKWLDPTAPVIVPTTTTTSGGGATVSPLTPVATTSAAVLCDETWALAEKWEKAGFTWTGQGIKAIVAVRKGER